MQTFKVHMSDEVNGKGFSYTMEYLAENSFQARVAAYREFGDSVDMQIDKVVELSNTNG